MLQFFQSIGYQIRVVVSGLDRMREINRQQIVAIAVKHVHYLQFLWITINCGLYTESFENYRIICR